MGNDKVRVKSGKMVLIKDVWYVLSMKSNLMSVGQLIEKYFSVTMKDSLLKLYGSDQKLIMQYKQRSKSKLNALVHKVLKVTVSYGIRDWGI